MDRDTATQISKLIRLHSVELRSFRLEETLKTPLVGFHDFADNKDCVGAYRIASESTALYVLLIQWNPDQKHPEQFYLIVYRSDRRGPVYEIREISEKRLIWKYQPTKRDGRNAERKEKFNILATQAGLLEDSNVKIVVPEMVADLDDFLWSVFRLAKVRDEADDVDSPLPIGAAAEAVFKAANASSRYAAKRQKTGFQLQFDGQRAGGWDAKGHWYILNPFASTVHDDHKTILDRHGFKQQGGHQWWRLPGEAEASTLCRTIAELTVEPLYLAIPGEEQFESYTEGLVEKVVTNRYERDPRNRQAAIGKHGTRCFGCDLEMQEQYGEIARDFIHIHHTRPLSKTGGPITPDLADLIPLCPNCHAVVHLEDPPLTIRRLRRLIGSAARR